MIEASDRVLTFRVTGLLKHSEFAVAQQQAGDLIRQRGKVRFLVLLEDLAGTEQGGDWGDVSFPMENDSLIEKIAVVGDKQWEEPVSLFIGRGIRRIPIQYFAPADLPKAKAWIAA